jgi:hypothetical protein
MVKDKIVSMFTCSGLVITAVILYCFIVYDDFISLIIFLYKIIYLFIAYYLVFISINCINLEFGQYASETNGVNHLGQQNIGEFSPDIILSIIVIYGTEPEHHGRGCHHAPLGLKIPYTGSL